MRRAGVASVGVAAGLFLLGGCGQAPERTADASAPIVDAPMNGMASDAALSVNMANAANAAAPERAADEAAVRGVVDALYASYEGRGVASAASYPLSPDLRAAWNRAVGTDGALAVDPYCACAGHDAAGFTHVVRHVEVADGRAHVAVSVTAGQGAQPASLWYDLLKTPRGWLIDDLSDSAGRSLKGRFKAAAPGTMAARDQGGARDEGDAVAGDQTSTR